MNRGDTFPRTARPPRTAEVRNWPYPQYSQGQKADDKEGPLTPEEFANAITVRETAKLIPNVTHYHDFDRALPAPKVWAQYGEAIPEDEIIHI